MGKTDFEDQNEAANSDDQKSPSKTEEVSHEESAMMSSVSPNPETKVGKAPEKPGIKGPEAKETYDSKRSSLQDAKICISHLNCEPETSKSLTKPAVYHIAESAQVFVMKEEIFPDSAAKLSETPKAPTTIDKCQENPLPKDSFESMVQGSLDQVVLDPTQSDPKTSGSEFNDEINRKVVESSSGILNNSSLDIQNIVQCKVANEESEASDDGLWSRIHGSVLSDKTPLHKEVLQSPVAEFYNNRSIFITGATGFMGKVLVSKNFDKFFSKLFTL